jgi:dTDP-4-dehydrorhamnose 3,5-epimerase
MRFTPLPLAGAMLIDIEPIADERGFFARSWCREEFARHGLEAELAQCNISFNAHPGTLRGLHFQAAPHGEAKLVRCTQGAIWDVIVDLRPTSPTYLRWTACELDQATRRALYIPVGFAHGFQTMAPDSEVFYQMSAAFVPGCARGARWDDPAFAIRWPETAQRVISDRDRAYQDFAP